MLTLRALNESNVRFVDQCGGVERLPRLFMRQFRRGETAQLIVHERQQLRGGVRVALLDGGQDAGDFGHLQSRLQKWQIQWPKYNRRRRICRFNSHLALFEGNIFRFRITRAASLAPQVFQIEPDVVPNLDWPVGS